MCCAVQEAGYMAPVSEDYFFAEKDLGEMAVGMKSIWLQIVK
jgi:hypothetical protein